MGSPVARRGTLTAAESRSSVDLDALMGSLAAEIEEISDDSFDSSVEEGEDEGGADDDRSSLSTTTTMYGGSRRHSIGSNASSSSTSSTANARKVVEALDRLEKRGRDKKTIDSIRATLSRF